MNSDENFVTRRRETPSLGLQVWATIPGRFPRAKTTLNPRPQTEMEALMQARPHDEPSESWDERQALRESVGAVVDCLRGKDRAVIEALYFEGLSIRDVEQRLGIPKTSVTRIRDRALLTLQDLMTRSQPVRERITVTDTQPRPSDWEEAARAALFYIVDSTYEVQDFTTEATEAVDAAYFHWNNFEASRMWEEFSNAARIAWVWLEQNYAIPRFGATSESQLFEEIVELLMERQAKYGHANIMKFEELGLAVRMSDKTARLGNLEEAARTFDDESIIDTWMDILGYGTIARMVQLGWFDLELPES